jgi:hypothetical protein
MRSATETGAAGEVVALDGRRARSARSREAAADAILDLLDEGLTELPGAAEVAERSGLSTRTVFRLFDDLESLYAAAVMRQRPPVRSTSGSTTWSPTECASTNRS